MPLRLALVLFVLLLAPACDTVEEQRDFEALAYLPPNGLANDDWRIAPLFETAAFFLQEPAPNPAPATELVAFTLRVQEPAAFANGLTLETSYDLNGNGQVDAGESVIVFERTDYDGELQLFVDYDPRRTFRGAVLPPGATYRLRVLSGSEIVTYGDIQLAR